MSEHARLGCSNERWPNCPRSPWEEARFEDVAGEAAIDGTGSHLLLEMCLQNNVQALQYDGQIIGANHEDNPNGWLIMPDRCERVQKGLNYVARRVKELKEQFPGATVIVEAESRSNPGGLFGRTDWWGTCDVTITVKDSMTGECLFLEVIDYKDGRMYVDVWDNTQLIGYLAGKMRPFVGSGPELVKPFQTENVKSVRQTIVQPKTKPPIRYDDDTTPFGIMKKADDLCVAAYATDDPNAPLIPGKHCLWCKANIKRGGDCNAATEQSLTTVANMTSEVATTDGQNLFELVGKMLANPKDLDNNQLADLADAQDPLMAAFGVVLTEVQLRVEQGHSVPGWAMRPGNGSRVYTVGEEEIAKALKGRRMKKDQIYPAKLITPAAVLASSALTKEQKTRFEKDFITMKAGKDSLQKVSRDYLAEKLVEGDVVQSDTSKVELMFGDVVQKDAVEITESFLDESPSFI